MILGPVFEQFVNESPLSVMSRATIEYALPASFLDGLFERTAESGYTRELLFSTTVDLLSLVVNPFGNPNDRKWQPLKIDLSAYAGKTVDLIFNTRSSPPDPPRDDRNGDLPVWGDPRIVTR